MTIKIMLDWDGTIYDFCKEYFDLLNEKYNLELKTEHITDYNFSDYFRKMGFCNELIAQFLKELETYEGFYIDNNYRNETVYLIINKLKELSNPEVVIYTKVFSNKYAKKNKLKKIKEFINSYPELKGTSIILDGDLEIGKDIEDYDIIIDDNPELALDIVKQYYYLKKVWMPIHRYNEYLLDSDFRDRIEGI